MTAAGYDLIGDIHGHADALETLLGKLGYARHAGVWRHPERKAVFLGDLIDRGPRQLDVVDIVRRMTEEGHAHAIMGNHEFNAIAWYSCDDQGAPLRAHTDKNHHQHQAFLAALEGKPDLYKSIIDWFMTLPLWMSFEGFNVIHACWHRGHMDRFASVLKPGNRLASDLMTEAAIEPEMGTAQTLFHAVEVWLKGLEAPLPEGHHFHDKEGNLRRNVRVRWWDRNAVLFPEAAMASETLRQSLPALPIPPAARHPYAEDKPVFFGHYWLNGTPSIQCEKTACLDYSVARAGQLVAYRWSGESRLTNDHLVGVSAG